MSAATPTLEVIFPSHGRVDDPWSLTALSSERHRWLIARGLRPLHRDMNVQHFECNGERMERWSYVCEVVR
jgi:hypothetical protein